MGSFCFICYKRQYTMFCKNKERQKRCFGNVRLSVFFKKNGIFFKNTIEILFFPLYNIQCSAVVFQHNNQQKKLQLRRMQ